MSFEQNFLVELSKMERRGFPFNYNSYMPYIMRDDLKEKTLRNILCSITGNVNLERTGEIADIIDLRKLLRDVLGKDYKYLYNNIGEVVIDRVHLLVLKEIVAHRNIFYYDTWSKDDVQKVLNYAFVYCVIDQFNNEMHSIKRQIKRGMLFPHTNHNINRLVWKACPEYFNKYIVYSSNGDGYTEYIFENKYILESYVVSDLKGISFKEAEAYIREQKRGLFLSEISIELESEILTSILNNEFYVLKGELAGRLEEENDKIYNDIGEVVNIEEYNVYHERLMPLLIKFMGRFIGVLNEEKQNNNLTDEDFYINYVSVDRIGIAVKSDLDIRNILKYGKSFKRVDSGYITYYFKEFVEVE